MILINMSNCGHEKIYNVKFQEKENLNALLKKILCANFVQMLSLLLIAISQTFFFQDRFSLIFTIEYSIYLAIFSSLMLFKVLYREKNITKTIKEFQPTEGRKKFVKQTSTYNQFPSQENQQENHMISEPSEPAKKRVRGNFKKLAEQNVQ